MKNSDPITYKGVEYPSAYIEMDGTIGCIRIATEALLRILKNDGLDEAEVPGEVGAVDNQIAYYVTDEEFKLPIREVKKSYGLPTMKKVPMNLLPRKASVNLKRENSSA